MYISHVSRHCEDLDVSKIACELLPACGMSHGIFDIIADPMDFDTF